MVSENLVGSQRKNIKRHGYNRSEATNKAKKVLFLFYLKIFGPCSSDFRQTKLLHRDTREQYYVLCILHINPIAFK